MVRGLEQTEKQSKHWIFNDHWTKWNGMNECVDPIMELPIRIRIRIKIRVTIYYDKISENGRNIYEWNQINQTILEIDFHRANWNGRVQSPCSLTIWRFGISKYYQYSIFRTTFQCHWTRIIETTSFRIDNGC